MANPSKAKGTAAETQVCHYLKSAGWYHAERRALHGNVDKGDVTGIPGVCIEIKSHKVSSLNFGAYVDEAVLEGINSNADVAAAWVKRRGTTDPGKWIVAMTGEQFASLLKAAGY